MNARVIGLDLSYSDTGLADFDPRIGGVSRASITTSPHDYPATGAGKKRRVTRSGVRQRIYDITCGIRAAIDLAPRPALIAIEGPSYGSNGNALHELGGLWWYVYSELENAGHPVAVVPPSTLKKYATNNGSATKPDMRVALLTRAGVDERNDNRVDGHWLAAAAADHLGHPLVDLPKAQREALDKVAWPEVS